jgi:flagellar protein FliS
MYAPHPASNAYARIGLETGVAAASPHKLIEMLYEGAEKALRDALVAHANGDIPGRAKAISKASTLVTEGLRGALDPVQGGEIASRLDALYDYIGQRLLHANLHRETAPLEEALTLLGQLRSAWVDIGLAARAEAAAARTASFNVAA